MAPAIRGSDRPEAPATEPASLTAGLLVIGTTIQGGRLAHPIEHVSPPATPPRAAGENRRIGRSATRTLVQHYRRCGRPTRSCADTQHPGHGPNCLLTRTVKGKIRSQSIPASQVKATQTQIAECRRLRRLVAELIDVSDDLCRSRLNHGTSAK